MENTWRSDLCNCCDGGCCRCCYVFACTACAAGDVAARIGGSYCIDCFVAGYMFPCVSICCWADTRSKVRNVTNVPGDCCTDCCVMCFCTCCAILQELNHLDKCKTTNIHITNQMMMNNNFTTGQGKDSYMPIPNNNNTFYQDNNNYNYQGNNGGYQNNTNYNYQGNNGGYQNNNYYQQNTNQFPQNNNNNNFPSQNNNNYQNNNNMMNNNYPNVPYSDIPYPNNNSNNNNRQRPIASLPSNSRNTNGSDKDSLLYNNNNNGNYNNNNNSNFNPHSTSLPPSSPFSDSNDKATTVPVFVKRGGNNRGNNILNEENDPADS